MVNTATLNAICSGDSNSVLRVSEQTYSGEVYDIPFDGFRVLGAGVLSRWYRPTSSLSSSSKSLSNLAKSTKGEIAKREAAIKMRRERERTEEQREK